MFLYFPILLSRVFVGLSPFGLRSFRGIVLLLLDFVGVDSIFYEIFFWKKYLKWILDSNIFTSDLL